LKKNKMGTKNEKGRMKWGNEKETFILSHRETRKPTFLDLPRETSVRFHEKRGFRIMVTITFAFQATEKRALAFLLGRFSGWVPRIGEHLVPEAALEALADQNIPFTVKGKTTYEQQVAAIRGAAASPVH
jgi:hypothetical protein